MHPRTTLVLPRSIPALLLSALALMAGCWISEGEGKLNSSCQLNSDCTSAEAHGLYCNEEKVCARDCEYGFEQDCPSGLTCTFLGQCCAPDAGPVCRTPVIIISNGDDLPDASALDGGTEPPDGGDTADAGKEMDAGEELDGGRSDAGETDSGS